MRKWILGAAVLSALSAGAAQAQATTPTSAASQNAALQLMLQKGVITQAEYDQAMADIAAAKAKESAVVVEQKQMGQVLKAPSVSTKWSATLYGFTEIDFMFDTTQSLADLWGNTVINNYLNGDYQATHHRMQFSVRNTRVGFRLEAPEWGSVKSSGVIECDFFGNQPSATASNPGATPPNGTNSTQGISEANFYNNPTFRIRHAYAKLESPVVDLLFGQTWELFGWQSYFQPNTVDLQGVPGEVYSRTAQARISKTVKTDAVNVDLAVAASRPPQRDAWVPDLQGGIKLSLPGWKGVSTAGGTGTNIVPAALAGSATWRRFQVQVPGAAAGNTQSNVTEGWGYDIDLLLPLVPVSGTSRANGLTFTGDYVNGRGINDVYTGLSGGVSSTSSLLNTANQVNTDPSLVGEVAYDANGKLNTIAWREFLVGLQYYLPIDDGRVWVSGNFSQMYSNNIQNYAGNGKAAFFRENWMDVNVFWDATNAIRFGLEYAMVRQFYVSTDAPATNNRIQFSAWYLF